MPKFSYTVKDQSGKTIHDVGEAYSQAILIEKLQKQNYFIVNISELRAPGVSKHKKSKVRKFDHKKVKLNDLLSFARQLATMLEAGVDLKRSLEVIQTQSDCEILFKILLDVKKRVEQGESLSGSLAQYPKTFNPFWISLVEVGEASGTLPVVLNKLAFYMEQQASFRSTVVSGLIYPAILFTVSLGAITFFALFVGPRFESIFKSMNTELPMITVLLLTIFRFVKEKFFVIFLTIFGIVFAIRRYTKTYNGRMAFESFMLNLPKFGEVYRLIIVERFSSQLAILIDAGVPILYALDICERLVDNNTCSLIVSDIKEGVRQGELLTSPMERSGFFPPMCTQMIMVGEETGELSKMLKHVAGFYQTYVETFMKRFSTIIEPFMLVFMGGVIGVIVIAMFLPMFNIAQLGGAPGN